ncbi:hypothetical protein KAR48_05150 [bacterium]|nr:hypothetical protein [bacterium]
MKSAFAVFELFVIGLQAFIWIFLLILASTGHEWLRRGLELLTPWNAFILIILLSNCYVVGILVDRLASFLVAIYNPKRIFAGKGWLQKKLVGESADPRIALLSRAGITPVISFIEGIRSRARILRASLFNILMLIVSAIVYIVSPYCTVHIGSTNTAIVWIVILGAMLYILVFFILGTFEAGYEHRVAEALAISADDEQKADA